MLAGAQGHEMPDDDEEMNLGDDDLPEELLERERALQKLKLEKKAEQGQSSMFGDGLGYEVV